MGRKDIEEVNIWKTGLLLSFSIFKKCCEMGFMFFLFAEHMLLGSSLCIQAGMRWKQQQTS